MDISINQILPIGVIDAVAREALASGMSGVSVSDDTRIHLLDNSQATHDKANDVLSNYDGLTVTADKTIMNEGDADPIISCADALISADSDIGYIVLLDGAEYAIGTDVVTAGVVTMTLIAPVAGVYEITMYRRTGNYASGRVTITVSEV